MNKNYHVQSLVFYGAGTGTGSSVPLPVVSEVTQHGPTAPVARMLLNIELGN